MNRKTCILISAILLLALSVRIWGIDSESYWLDETISVHRSIQDFETSTKLAEDTVHQPLYPTMLWGWTRMFGHSETATRSLSVILGVLATYFTFLLGRKLFSEEIGIYSALLMAISPFAVYYSQETRAYSLFLLLGTLSFYSYTLLEEKTSKKRITFYVLSTLALLYSHNYGVVALFAQNIHKFAKDLNNRKRIYDWIKIQLMTVIPFIPGLIVIFKQALSAGENLSIYWIPAPTFIEIYNSIYELSGNFTLRIVLFAFIIITIYNVIRKNTTKKDNEKLVFLAEWFVAPFLFIIAYSYLFSSIYQTRYFIFTLPAIIIFMSWAATRITSWKSIKIALLLGIIGLSIFSVRAQYLSQDKDDWRSAAEYLEANVGQDDVIFVHPFYNQKALAYYYSYECFIEPSTIEIQFCNYEQKNILSLDPMQEFSGGESKVTIVNNWNTLENYNSGTIWFIDVRSDVYDQDRLYNYFISTKTISEKQEFGEEFEIYKFE